MEALSILRFWRTAATGGDTSSEVDEGRNAVAFASDDDETDEEDSFFDLVLKSPDRGADKGGEKVSRNDVAFIESPRDVLLSKSDYSGSKPMSPVTILRSTPKLKVFMLGFKKSSKCEKAETNTEAKASPLNQFSKPSKLDGSNRFSAKCRVAEMPVGPIFARDNSLRSKMMKETFDPEAMVSSEKPVPKYLKLIKPFYVKTSKKTKLSVSLTPSSSPVTIPVNLSPRKLSDGSRVASFKIMTRNLGKIRSATTADPPIIHRRDDSLLEQNDGIQGAILHCKKSYSSSSQDLSQLFRSSSDPLHENLRATLRNSCEEQKRCSI